MSMLKDHQQHQIVVQRRNLAQVCRFAVKGLIDRSCFDTIGEHSPEIVNFCNIMEHVLTHRLKPRSSWYTVEDRSFWEYIKASCQNVPHNCLKSLQNIEHITTARGKGRAWLKVVLMEKRLSEYIAAALRQTKVTKAYYMDGALMLSDEAQMLTGTLLGLNAMDFSFDLKGENVDIGGLPAIDYTPFLRFQQCPESVSSDHQELLALSNSNSSSSVLSEDPLGSEDSGDCHKARFMKMEAKYKAICEQKGYLEELVRLRENQLEEVHAQRRRLIETLHHLETENKRERSQLESVIIELQAQLATVKHDHQKLTKQMKAYLGHHQAPPPIIQEPSMEAIGYHDIQRSPLRSRAHGESDRHSFGSNDLSVGPAMSDTRSLLSELSAASALREETSSMIPLAGSFTSLNSIRSGETKNSETATKFKIDFVKNDPMTSAVDTSLLSPVAMAVLESNARDNDNEDVENDSYYMNNKVCVTALVHRADSLMSPVDDKSSIPGEGSRENCDKTRTSDKRLERAPSLDYSRVRNEENVNPVGEISQENRFVSAQSENARCSELAQDRAFKNGAHNDNLISKKNETRPGVVLSGANISSSQDALIDENDSEIFDNKGSKLSSDLPVEGSDVPESDVRSDVISGDEKSLDERSLGESASEVKEEE